MTAASLLNPRDSQILQLLRDGAPIQRVIDIGRHRRSWTPIHVGSVVAFHLDDRPALTVVPEPKPTKPRRAAKCGTIGGHESHRRHGEKPCEPCTKARLAYQKEYRARRREERTGVVLTEWAPEPFTGTPTDVILTAAQVRLLEQICQGMTNPKIAKAEGIPEETLKSRVQKLLRLLGASDRSDAARRIYRSEVRVYVSDAAMTQKGESVRGNKNEVSLESASVGENGCGRGAESPAAAPPSSVDHRRAVPE